MIHFYLRVKWIYNAPKNSFKLSFVWMFWECTKVILLHWNVFLSILALCPISCSDDLNTCSLYCWDLMSWRVILRCIMCSVWAIWARWKKANTSIHVLFLLSKQNLFAVSGLSRIHPPDVNFWVVLVWWESEKKKCVPLHDGQHVITKMLEYDWLILYM